MSVEIKSNTLAVKNNIDTGVGLAIRWMLDDIYVSATPYTPRKTGDLRQRVLRKMEGNNKGVITWESSYAGVQEQGYRRSANGIVFFRNYTTSNTGAHYAKDAVVDIVSQLPQYIDRAGIL